MDAQVAKEKIEQAAGGLEERGIFARVRASLGDSAWGAIAGKGALYLTGFALLAAVGSGSFRSLTPPASGGAPVAAASAAPPSPPPAASSAAAASGQGSPAPVSGPDAGAGADGGVPESDAAAAGSASGGGLMPDGKVVLNRATEEDLRHLPGIGATRAKAILALRAKLGRFSRLEELLRVKGIGRKSLARLRPKVVID